MNKHELEFRTKKFAVGVIRFVETFERSASGRVVGNQLLKSATSIGANYREANRAVSRKDFSYRISIAEKEASETSYWLEICMESEMGDSKNCLRLLEESREILAIFTAIGRSMRANDHRSSNGSRSSTSEPEPSDYGCTDCDPMITDLLPSDKLLEMDTK